MYLYAPDSYANTFLCNSYHVPEVRIVTCEPLRPGKPSELLLKFCNPTRHETQVTILPLDTPITPTVTVLDEREEFKQENMQQVNARYFLNSFALRCKYLQHRYFTTLLLLGF